MKEVKIKTRTIIFLAALSIALSFFYTKAEANSISLAVDPPIIKIYATPPADISASLSIQNLESEPLTIKAFLKPFVPSDKSNGELNYLISGSFLSDETNFLQAVKLYDGDKLLNSNFVLAPQQKKKITLKLNIPKDYTGSDHYFSIIFLSTSEEDYKSSHSHISGGIAANVLFSANKSVKIQGEIHDFKIPFFIKENPASFDVKIINNSKAFISPQGRILIKNMFGQVVGNIELAPSNILANSSRFITNQIGISNNQSLYEGNFDKPKVIWSDSFIAGYYTANLTVSLSEQGPILTKTTRFIAFPIKRLLLIIIPLAIAVFLAKRIKTKLNYK